MHVFDILDLHHAEHERLLRELTLTRRARPRHVRWPTFAARPGRVAPRPRDER
jgi:hypothetical protein